MELVIERCSHWKTKYTVIWMIGADLNYINVLFDLKYINVLLIKNMIASNLAIKWGSKLINFSALRRKLNKTN